MQKSHIFYTLFASIAIVGVLIGLYSLMGNKGAGGDQAQLATLASCLAESGTTFYGAFWCSHCQEQKRDFGSASEALPYVECSTADGRGQTEACAEAKIESYPTWELPNGERLNGRIALASLAGLTGCPAPAQDTESAS